MSRGSVRRVGAFWRIVGVVATAMLLLTACGGGDGEEPQGEDGTAAEQASLVIQADMVQGPGNVPEAERGSVVCVLNSRFPRHSEVVWRAAVVDGATGEELDDTQIESVTVELADGQTFDMRYGPHPQDNPNDFFWTTSWEVPADYPTGTVSFTITATSAETRSAEFEPFQVQPSLLTITEETLEPIEQEG